MKYFEVIITPDAENDLNELDDYITFQLLSPDTAISYIRDIRTQIAGLETSPTFQNTVGALSVSIPAQTGPEYRYDSAERGIPERIFDFAFRKS